MSIAKAKKVKFERDSSYDVSKVPKRGSSRGTSVNSSQNLKEDAILNEFDDFFAKEYNVPKEATTKSISDTLNNSKKNSPAGSNNAKLLDDVHDQ